MSTCPLQRYSDNAMLHFSHNASTLRRKEIVFHSYRSRLVETAIASYSYCSRPIGNISALYSYDSDNMTKAITCNAVTF